MAEHSKITEEQIKLLSNTVEDVNWLVTYRGVKILVVLHDQLVLANGQNIKFTEDVIITSFYCFLKHGPLFLSEKQESELAVNAGKGVKRKKI